MYTVYGIKNCNTVKKALDFLNQNQIEYTFHDYKKSGIELSKIEEWLTQYPWEDLVNKKGTTWKQIPESERPVNQQEAVELMLSKTSVIKRPIVESN